MQRPWGREEHGNRRSQRQRGQGVSGVRRRGSTVAGPVSARRRQQRRHGPVSHLPTPLRLIPSLHPRGCKPFTCIDFHLTDLQNVHEYLVLVITSFFEFYIFAFRCAGSPLPLRLLSSCGARGLSSGCEAWTFLGEEQGALGYRRFSSCGFRPWSMGTVLWDSGLRCLQRVRSSRAGDRTCVS